MEYLIIILLVILIILVTILLFRKSENNDITERLGRFEVNIIKEMNSSKENFSRNLTTDFDKLNQKVEERLLLIENKVNSRIDENFEKTNKTFTSIVERLSKIDEAQKKIDNLSVDIISLQSVLTDKKSRGTFGEVNLRHIVGNVFGEKNDSIYQMQYTFNNGNIADCVLFAPAPLGVVAIDSKFPLENYQLMVDKNIGQADREVATKKFKADFKKHIDDISTKYIIPGVTSDQAIMFLPAEAIFAEVNAYHTDLIEYAYKKRVWLTSPTTLISTLSVIEMIIKNMERDKYAAVIHDELKKLGLEFERYKERWDKLSRSIETVNKDVENIHTTTDKISKRFISINQVDVDQLKEK